jgi:hypothetical protein
MNGLAKRIKRIAFGLRNFTHWRIRVLLYAGKPDWSKLPTVTPSPAEIRRAPEQADRRPWLILAAYTQPGLALLSVAMKAPGGGQVRPPFVAREGPH